MSSLLAYYEANRPRTYATSEHHRLICEVVERCYRERKHGIVEVPPRHGKSEIINVYAPAWWLAEGHHDSHFGLVCNGQDLSNKFCRASRNLCKLPVTPDHTSEWKLASDKSLDWTFRGTGINGSLAGFGYSEMSFDDLFKNGQEAKSDVEPQAGEPGKSLVQEVALLRTQVAQLCQATRGLVTLISVLDKKVDTALKGGIGADFAVL